MSPEAKTDTQPLFVLDVSTEVLDLIPNALCVLALDGTISAVNRAALKLLNAPSSAIIGRHFSFFLRTLNPPLLTGGFPTLLELGEARFDIAVRCGKDRFIQVEIQLVVLYDEQNQPSSVLVINSDGSSENILLRRAVAKVADQVSQMIAYDSSTSSLWPKIFSLGQELFDTPGGWLVVHGTNGEQRIPVVFGLLQEQLDRFPNNADNYACPCTQPDPGVGEPCATNSMDCPWLASPSAEAAASVAGLATPSNHHAVVPILNATGQRVADICLLTPVGRIFHPHELALMDAIADQIGQALDRGEIHLSNSLDGWERVLLGGDELSSPELIALLEQILDNLATLVPFVSAGVFLLEGDSLRLVAAVSNPQAEDLRNQLFPLADNPLNRTIVGTRSLIILDDVRQDARFQQWVGLDYIRGWMGLPLVVNERVIGIITVDSDRVGGFSQRDGEVAQTFADQAAVTVEKARLAAELGREKRNMELLYQLSQSLITTLEPQAVAKKALDLLTATFGDCLGEIYVLEKDQDFLQLLAAKNYLPHIAEQLPNQPYLRVGVGIAGTAVELRRPILVPNIYEEPRWLWIPDLDLGVRSLAAIPLISQNEVIGLLALSSSKTNVFTHESRSLLQSIATPVALALQNAQLFAAERRRRQEAEMLRNATEALALDLRLEQILQILLERLRQVVPFSSACVLLLDGKRLHAVAEMGLPLPDQVVDHYFPVDNSFFTNIQRERRALYFEDVQKLPRFSGWGGTSTTRGWMGVPLVHRGDVLGYITLDSLQVAAYGEQEASLAQAFANQVAVTLVNAQLLQDSQRAASEQQEISGMMRGLNGAVSLAGIREAIAAGLHRLIGAAAVEIALYQNDKQQVSAEHWDQMADGKEAVSVLSYGFDESAALVSILQGQSHISPDITAENQWPVERAWAEQGYRSGMALPLQGSKGILGHIRLFWRDQLVPDRAILFSLRQICDGVAMAAERFTLLQQATRRADELQILIQLSEKLRGSEGREAIVQTALATCLEMFSAEQGYLMVPTEDGEALEVIAQLGSGPIAPAHRLGYADSISGHVFRTGISYCSPNLFTDSLGYRPNLQHWADLGVSFMSAIYAPLRAGDQITGILTLANMETRRIFSQGDLRMLDAIAEITGGALHRASILEGLEQRVTDRTADLAQANLRLLELDQLKSDFVANVSHELRTPLTNIKLHLELLEKGRPERREHYLQVMQSEAEQLHALIESILQLSALDVWDDQTEKFTIVSLNELTETIFDRFQEQASAAELDFVYQPGPLPLFIQGSLEHLQQIVVNLVTNAIRYTPPHGRVLLTLRTNSQGEAGIVVQDTGIGIPADEIDSIFERFYRSKRVRDAQISGTGLGLAIVKEIAQAHGGRVQVESVPDIGTTISAWFPQARMKAPIKTDHL